MTDQDISRGARAEALLNDDLIKEAFKALRDDYLKAWEATKYNATDDRERLWQAIQIIGKVEAHLKTVVSNGKIARAQIDQDLAKPKRFGII